MTQRCALLFFLGLALAVLAHRPMGWFLGWLRRKSDFKDPRPTAAVPNIITGTFERLLAFILIVFCVDDALTVLGIWLGLKLAANWQAMAQLQTSDPRKSLGASAAADRGRQIRVGTFTALMTGVVSVGLGVIGGLVARWGCGLCPVAPTLVKFVQF